LVAIAIAIAIAMTAAVGVQVPEPRNLVLFVPDGLRAQIVTDKAVPVLATLRDRGENSHSLFPTFTTSNASALATGHYLADTGNFGNLMYMGVRVPAGNATVGGFLESDPVLSSTAARAQDLGAAFTGKVGPTGIFDLGA